MSTNGHLKFQGTNRATFVGATSNIMFDTTTTSLGIGVTGTDHPSSNLYITGNAYISNSISVGGVLTMGTVNVVARHDLEAVTAMGNTTPLTIEFSNATTGIVTTGNVEVGGELTVSGNVSDLNVVSNVNMLHTANTASIKLNSNVVAEFPRSKKLIKYPRVALTSAAQTGSGYEGYFVSQDSATLNGTSNRQAWAFFDTQGPGQGAALASPHLVSSTDRFDGNGNYTGGDSLAGVSGDWIYIRLPDKIQLQSVDLWARYDNQRNPVDATVLGSLNGTNWSVIGSWQNAKFESGGSTSFTINSIQYYDYIGFVFEKIEANSSGGYINFHEIDLYGIPEYDPEAYGTDVVVKSVPNVPNTDWLKVYYDAKDLTNVSSPISDLSGNSVNGVVNGNINVSDGAFVFDGVGDTITGTVSGVSGDYPHTVTMWIKFNNIHADNSGDTFFEMGARSGNDMIGLYADPTKFHYYFFNNDHHYNYTVTNGVWYHVTATYSGGDSVNGRKLYINGAAIRRTTTGSGGNYTLASGNFTLGGLMAGHSFGDTYSFKGSIANFRFFDRALSSDEIGQLYTYQKEDFGHSTNSLTLKGGRLGIGTSEPRAALDVRGDLFGPGVVQVRSTTFDGITSGSSSSFITLSGLTTSITPKRTGSKILVLLNLFWSGQDDAYFQGNVKKDGTVLVKQEGSVGSASKTSFAMLNYDRGQYFLGNIGFSYLDDTNIGTEPIEYTVEVRNRAFSSQSWYINYTSDTADANRLTGVSTLTLIEIQQ